MKNIDITTPDGKTLTLSAPDTATDSEIQTRAQMAVAHYKQTMPPPDPSTMDKIKSGVQAVTDSPLYKATPMGVLGTVNDMVHKGANAAGEAVTNAMGGSGIPGVSNPNVAAGVGTAIQMAPDIATAAFGGGAAQDAAQAGKLGMAGRIVSGPARADAGAAIGAAEQAAGTHADIIPTLKDAAANLGLKNVSAKQYLNALMERLKSGDPMSPQALSQHHKMISDLLANEPSPLAKTVMGAKSNLGAQGSVTAAKADAELVQQLNEAAPGRADAAANYRAAMLRNKGYKVAAGTGLAALTGDNLTKILSKVMGSR